MCMFLLIAVIFKCCTRDIADPDIWWHLRNAQNLLEHGSFSRVDSYSFTAAGSPWLSDQWLSEIPYYLGFKAWGLQGVLVVYFAVLVLIFVGVYYLSCRSGADCKDATITTLLAILLGIVSIGPRTLLFGWLCMVGLLLVLDRFQRTGKSLWLLPPLFAVWVNLHGSWVFGMVVLTATIASGFVEGDWSLVETRRWSPAELKQILTVFAASLAALFVNPFGYRLVFYPFDLLLRHKGVMQYLDEWHSVDFDDGHGKLVLAVIFGLLAAALFSRRKWRLAEVLVTIFALWAALSHVRFLFFLGLIVAPIFATRLQLFPPYERDLDKPWLNAGIMAAVLAWMIFAFPSAAVLQEQVNQQFPVAAVDFMQRQHLNGRIFNQFGWGGYIEWNAPQFKPFSDTRADIFVYNGIFDDYMKAVAIQTPLEVLNNHNIGYVLIEAQHPLGYLLKHSPAWHPIYSDKVALLFERVPTTAAGN